MTKPTDEIKEALGGVGGKDNELRSRIWSSEKRIREVAGKEGKILYTIRTALKEYGKAKTVPRRFIDRVWDMAVDCVEYPHAVYGDLFKEGFLSALEEQGIEVMDDEIIVAEDENNDKK